MDVLVVGLAATGLSVVEYTRAAGHEVTVLEDSPGPAFAERAHAVRSLGAEVVERPSAESAATLGRSCDLVVPSPGVHPDHPAIAAADAAGIPVRSEIDLAAARLRARPDAPKLVAVTGTNGKTTVTTLVDLVLRAAGLRSVAAGNIGRPLIEAAGDAVDVIVAEVSSFQLAFTTSVFAPDVAVLLNVAEDHLDWHGTFDAYAAAKGRIFEHQGEHALAVVNADDPVADRIGAAAPGRLARYSVGEPSKGGYGVLGEMLVGPDGPIAPAPASHAPHDRGNALGGRGRRARRRGDSRRGHRHPRDVRRPPAPRAAGARGGRCALVRRLQGHQPARHRRRAARIRVRGADRRWSQQGARSGRAA